VIEVFEKFLQAGVNHFVIRFWGSNYFGSIDQFANKVIPYFKDQEK
jgi:phthiodiolone/phenolphthiodiolone dimycocerosates ketoreductase